MHWHGFETDTDAGLYLLTFFGNGHRLTLGYCAHKRLMRVSLHSETYDDPFVLYAVGDGYAAPESNTAGIRMLAHPMGRAFSHVARHMIEADA